MPVKSDSVTKASKKLLDLLNEAISRELQVSIQYMWQHVQWGGVKGFAVQSEFKSIAMQEMKHAESIAERLYYLGGIPNTKPTPIKVDDTLKAMVEQDIKDEAGAITLYKQIIDVATQEKDVTTAFLFQDILKAEEDHHDTFTTLLEDL
ncbi:MAG: ferritin-like domain-containing protein [Chloroflexi bacterium]|nr:ferritin-like domain-containing protein [Chloroflexota bacterium]